MADAPMNIDRPTFIDVLPDNNKPALSTGSDRPVIVADQAAETRPEVKEAADLAASDKEQADIQALADAKDGKPPEEVKEDSAEKDGSNLPEKKEVKPDLTPPEEKRYITRAKNQIKALEEQLNAERENTRVLRELAQKFVPDPNVKTLEPKREAFDDPDAYIEARAGWLADQRVASMQQEQQRKAQESEAQKVQREYQERLSDAEDKYPGIADIAKDPTLPVSDAMGAAIITSDKAPDILHYLDEHRDDAKRIAQLTPARAAAEIGKIEAQLSAPKPRETSKAPKPITPVGGNGGIIRDKYDPGISDAEYFAIVEQERKQQLASMNQRR